MNALNELREHARRVGEKLVEDLRFAEVTTNSWSNLERSDLEVSQIMNSCLDDLASTNCWGEANRNPSGVLWKVAGEVLSVGWLQQHARQKPRGYAGDFEMLEKIVHRTLCSDPLGRAFDHFFQEQAAANAIRCRTQLVADRIVQLVRASTREKVHICSVGAGPAIDVEVACGELSGDERGRLTVTLLDLDPEALVHAERRLTPVLRGDQVRSQRENLFRLPRLERTGSLLEQPDFIVCTGLFDYLTDADAVAMLQYFWSHLATDGELMVFNFAPSNPSRAYMEWIGNWYLMYRNEAAVAALVHEAIGDNRQTQIAREDSQASLYAVCRKS
ncbi:MAG: class I SAM-dependent methyltransferase [Planctomycetota bacterium]|nr:class I SAM-dependent methyltransferase [Planctomycetota bacterium]